MVDQQLGQPGLYDHLCWVYCLVVQVTRFCQAPGGICAAEEDPYGALVQDTRIGSPEKLRLLTQVPLRVAGPGGVMQGWWPSELHPELRGERDGCRS